MSWHFAGAYCPRRWIGWRIEYPVSFPVVARRIISRTPLFPALYLPYDIDESDLDDWSAA